MAKLRNFQKTDARPKIGTFFSSRAPSSCCSRLPISGQNDQNNHFGKKASFFGTFGKNKMKFLKKFQKLQKIAILAKFFKNEKLVCIV